MTFSILARNRTSGQGRKKTFVVSAALYLLVAPAQVSGDFAANLEIGAVFKPITQGPAGEVYRMKKDSLVQNMSEALHPGKPTLISDWNVVVEKERPMSAKTQA